MRILFDARLLRGGGIGRFTREVTARWLADPDVSRIRFLGRPDELEPWLREVDERDVGVTIPFPHSSYSPGAQMAWLRKARELRGDGDVAFFPHYDAPLLRHPSPSVVVVHDLIQFRFRQGFPVWKRAGGRILLNGALKRASRIVTVSERSRRDLEAWRSHLKGKIDVVTPGVSETFRPLEAQEQVGARKRWKHLVPFLLVVGPVKPHKNLELAVRVLRELADDHPELRLVRAGATGHGRPGLLPVAQDLHMQDRVTEVGILDDRRVSGRYITSRRRCCFHPVTKASGCRLWRPGPAEPRWSRPTSVPCGRCWTAPCHCSIRTGSKTGSAPWTRSFEARNTATIPIAAPRKRIPSSQLGTRAPVNF